MTASSANSQFDEAIARYNAGADPAELIPEFLAITRQSPRQSAGWTCLAWLQLLADRPLDALRSARQAVRLNPQDPQARINLSLAMLETGATGVREHIDIVRRVMAMAPDLAAELEDSIQDGLRRRPGWTSMEKVRTWLAS
jgi:predicted Zn-dependent protease